MKRTDPVYNSEKNIKKFLIYLDTTKHNDCKIRGYQVAISRNRNPMKKPMMINYGFGSSLLQN